MLIYHSLSRKKFVLSILWKREFKKMDNYKSGLSPNNEFISIYIDNLISGIWREEYPNPKQSVKDSDIRIWT